jgi:hypothetical protein
MVVFASWNAVLALVRPAAVTQFTDFKRRKWHVDLAGWNAGVPKEWRKGERGRVARPLFFWRMRATSGLTDWAIRCTL